MKQCRFCDREVPFFGSDTCSDCRLRDDRDAVDRVKQNLGVIEFQKLFGGEVRKVRETRGESKW